MNYHEIHQDMTIGELICSGAYGIFADYIFTYMTPDHWKRPLKEYGFEKCGFVQGLHRMEELAAADGKRGESFVYNIYSPEERLSEWDKAFARYLFFPPCKIEENPSPRPYVIVLPGGGFNRQWGFIEGESIAASLNAMGYPVFVLFYRVKLEPLMPKPLEDLYRMIADIESRSNEFNIIPRHYMVGGFSAGATIVSEIGSINLGWETAGISKPKAIFLGYPSVSPIAFFKKYKQTFQNLDIQNGMEPFLRRIGGPHFSAESLEPYDLLSHIDTAYPPSYIVACEDDGIVPIHNSYQLDEKLTDLRVAHKTKIGCKGGHSFGLGVGTDVDGWLTEAVAFWKNNV